MDDPRFVSVRCSHRFLERQDLLQHSEYACQFRAGHEGLHYSTMMWRDQGEFVADPPMRWGTEQQLHEELHSARAALLADAIPDGVVKVTNDAWAEARRAGR